MKLLLLTTLQSALTVGGMGLLTIALGGRPMEFKALLEGVFTLQGIAGIVVLFGSFITTSIILSFARLSIFVPLNTGIVFLFTVLFAALVQDEKINVPILVGMSLIVAGIAIVSVYRPD